MADTKKPEGDAVAAPPKKKGKLMLFILVGAACLALGGGGAFFLLKKPTPAAGEDSADATTREPAKKKKADPGTPPVFYKFDKAFTVKLQTEHQEAYLQTEVQLKMLEQNGLDLIKQFEPELKHRLTLSLMNNKASSLSTAVGVQRLANELRDVANKVIAPPAETAKPSAETGPADAAEPGAPVQSVLFSTFIIQ
ncbi:MAG: flagellar basal body-associated FliL family protein [Sulfuritalea sp.]|nr:flagellar basal body-associated FliL family protein [Sulfuritalea sp.]